MAKALREHHGVADEAQEIRHHFQMGKQGVGALEETVKAFMKIVPLVYTHPLHVAVMCGKNEAMED